MVLQKQFCIINYHIANFNTERRLSGKHKEILVSNIAAAKNVTLKENFNEFTLELLSNTVEYRFQCNYMRVCYTPFFGDMEIQ